jgi:hypothetical protein
MTKQSKLIIGVFCLLKLILHIIADKHSGFQGDELLHIATGDHLAFGYMEFPPLIGILAFIQNLFHSNSIFAHHLFSHIASLLIIIYVAKTTIELGGKDKATFLALLCILIAPGFARSQQLFQPVVFSQLFWVLSFYHLVRFVKLLDKKSLLYLALFVVLGFSTKYDGAFFIIGLPALLLFKRTREAVIKNFIWKIILLSFLLILPNLIWQYSNDFPVLQMFGRLYETQLNNISRIGNLGQLMLAINPISLLLAIPAFIFLVGTKNKSVYTPIAVSIFLSILFLIFSNGKSYYFLPIILTILPFGGIFWEETILEKRKWIIYPLSIFLISGSVLIPFGLPIYSFDRYLNLIQKHDNKRVNGGKQAIYLDEYYTKEKWENTMQELKFVYDSLPTNEKQSCLIWGKHYAQAGAVNLFGPTYDLPKGFSYHGSFYCWTPKGQIPETIIALSYQVGDFFNPYFEQVIPVRKIYNPYADTEEELYQNIYICKKPRQDFDKMEELFKKRIFE